jgi:Flp pilus assembly protein TadG
MSEGLQFHRGRRGVLAVFAAIFLVVMVGMMAFAVDIGTMSLARSQLQVTADAAALAAASRISQGDYVATAQSVAAANKVCGRAGVVNSGDVITGVWDASTRTFAASNSTINAVKVTVKTNAASGGATPLFFAGVYGMKTADQSASAIATVNPRDIAFVVDLSASMNYNTRPNRATTTAAKAYIQTIYSNFGFGTVTETLPLTTTSSSSTQWAGYPLTGKKNSSWASDVITSLSASTYKTAYGGAYYTGTAGMTTTEKTRRAYAYVMDKQMAALMPNVIPAINSADSFSYTYWKDYLSWSPVDSSIYPYKSIGYLSYIQYMMELGRDNKTNSGYYTPLSTNSSYCPYHSVTTDAGIYSFPAEEMPTHAARIAIMDAIKIVKERNNGISDPNQKDWVSIITYDKTGDTKIFKSLTSDYDSVIAACTKLQACGSGAACTLTEEGMTVAHDHIQSSTDGGSGRKNVNKILVLLTDGAANLMASSKTTVTAYVAAHPSAYWLANTSSSNYWYEQAALMQAHKYQGNHWYTYPVGLGLSIDTAFMDGMANIAGTAKKDGSSMSSTDPTTAINDLKDIFSDILTRPKLRLVQ